jgi:hypothetical protein
VILKYSKSSPFIGGELLTSSFHMKPEDLGGGKATYEVGFGYLHWSGGCNYLLLLASHLWNDEEISLGGGLVSPFSFLLCCSARPSP